MKSPFLVLLLIISMTGYAQNIDSLLKKAFLSADSSDYYFRQAKKQIASKRDKAEYLFCKNAWHTDNGSSDSAVYYGFLAKEEFIKLKNDKKLLYVYNNLDKVYKKEGQYDMAVSVNLKGLDVAEKLDDDSFKITFLHNIATAYHDFEDFKKGIYYGKRNFEAALNAKIPKPLDIAAGLNAIAINYDDWGKADSALYYHYKVFDYVKGRDTMKLTSTYNNIGNTLLKQKKYEEAKRWIQTALEMTINDDPSEHQQYDFATNYTNLAAIAFNTNHFAAAQRYFTLADAAVRKSKSAEKRRDYLYQQYLFHKKKNDLRLASEFQEQYMLQRDSIFEVDRAKTLARLEAKYQNERKQKELIKSKAEIENASLELRRKNLHFIVLALISVGLVIIGWLIYRQQKLKNSQLVKEHELKTAISQIETQSKLQDQRLAISRDLHDNIGAQLTFIISSVDNTRYTFKTDDTIIGNKLQSISNFAKDTIVELRDTIWAMNSTSLTISDLQGRISNFVSKAKESLPEIEFLIEISPKATDFVLSSVEGMNLYRVIQEAVNNAIKHSGATAISVFFFNKFDVLNVTVSDNGNGFVAENSPAGNGIANMNKRIADVGGSVEIKTGPSGTTVSLRMAQPKALVHA